MNELRFHLPILTVLFIDTRQSANSTFLSCFKHITLAAYDRQHRYANLILQVTDFPTGPALDDYLLVSFITNFILLILLFQHIDEFVSERVLILVNDYPDDAYLRILRHRNFTFTTTARFDAEYLLVES